MRHITPGRNRRAIIPAAYLSPSSIREVIEFRQVVEGKTAQRAALRATDNDLLQLEEILSAMEKWKHDPQRFAKEDLTFHLYLAKITQNSLLVETLNIIRSLLSQAMYYTILHRGHSQGLTDHRLMINSIAKRDGAATMRIMEKHISEAYQTMEQWILQNAAADSNQEPS